MPGQLQTKDISDVKCLLRTIVIPSHVLKKNERYKKCRPVEFDSFIAFWRGRHKYGSLHGRTLGNRGRGASVFGISVNPISTRWGRLCLLHYYGPPGFPDLLTAMRWWCNLHTAQCFVLTKCCPVTISRTFYFGIMPKPSAPIIPNKETRWLCTLDLFHANPFKLQHVKAIKVISGFNLKNWKKKSPDGSVIEK